MKALVSIITPSYNSALVIAETIESILAQTYVDWELLIVDDASSDTSRDVISKYCETDNRVHLITLEENSGAAVARNRGIAQSQGKYIAFLDADDLWKKDKLKTQIAFMEENNYTFTYTHYSVIDDFSKPLVRNLFFPSRVSYGDLLKTCSIGCLTVVIDRTGFSDISMPNLRRGQDYALWLKLLKEVDFAYCIPEVLAEYRILATSLSRNKLKKLIGQWQIYRKVEKLPIFFSIYNILHYVYYGFKKNR